MYRSMFSRIYQIRVIDVASDKKSSIGSGFQVSAQGLIATNYHVISEYVQNPKRYRIEYLSHDGSKGELEIKALDVIHDLAIVAANVGEQGFLQLSSEKLSKGAPLYAMGNPHDLGMSIIDGSYNGLLEKSLYEKILFSGSLNPGMSGGPALNDRGHVVGVNVSTAGNDLSFLVPASYLQMLLERALIANVNHDYIGEIHRQIFHNQQQYMQDILSAEWQQTRLGDFRVPAELVAYFKCWGKSDDREDRRYEHTYTACTSPDEIYVSPDFDTGTIDFRYDWYDAQQLNRFQFYTLYSNKFSASSSTNQASKEDVNNYQCNTRFVTLASHDWKIAMCLRSYKKLDALVDLSLTMAQVSENSKGLLVNMNATGVSREMAFKFARRYMESIEWRN
ncbi:MAG: serine protease [Gammaproteobacteria bacterium]|nr:serine protease [Gammaproteobacteria bacterium]